MPFNQFKYDKDFDNAVKEIFNDESKILQSNDSSKLEPKQLDSAIGNYLKSYQMIIPSGTQDSVVFFEQIRLILEQTLEDNLEELGALKYSESVVLELVFRREVYIEEKYTDPPARFYTKNEAIFIPEDINLGNQFSQLNERIENFIQEGFRSAT